MTQTLTHEINHQAYTALTTAAAVQDRPNAGVIEMTDNDRVDFLQRMTTNDVAALKTGESVVTVLTTPVARNLFVFTVLCFDERLLLLPAAGEATALHNHLRSQIFFMDKVKINDVSETHARLRLLGPNAQSALSTLGINTPASAAEEFVATDDGKIIAVNQQAFDLPGYEIILPVDQKQAMLSKLKSADIPLIDDDAYHARRIELGRPQSGTELTEEYSPLESGLAWACAEDKGCYTGQEIIARQITYDKVTKTLVGLRLTEPATPGADIFAEGKSAGRGIGTITSVTHSPAIDSPIALAVIKRPHNEIGTTVSVGGSNAEVVALPFTS